MISITFSNCICIFKFHICMKTIFPVASGNRIRLQFAQVDSCICNQGQHFGQASSGMIRMKSYRALLASFTGSAILFSLENQKTGIIIFHRMDVRSDHIQLK